MGFHQSNGSPEDAAGTFRTFGIPGEFRAGSGIPGIRAIPGMTATGTYYGAGQIAFNHHPGERPPSLTRDAITLCALV